MPVRDDKPEKKPVSEKSVQTEIQLALGSRPDIRLWRNNTGTAWRGDIKKLADGSLLIRNPAIIKYGLCRGGSDLIGMRTITITADMVGQNVAVFCAIEVKSSKGTTSEEQNNFLSAVKSMGAYAGTAKSIQDAESILYRAKQN